LVDKTKIISRLIENGRKVYLITRTRRFGKSLNLKMVKTFFEKELNQANLNSFDGFDGLEVTKTRKNMRHFKRYPVIHINFKGDGSKDYDSAIYNIKDEIANTFLYQREKIDENVFKKILEESERNVWNEIEKKMKIVLL